MPSSLPYEVRGPILKADNVSLTLGGRAILKDISFEIKDLYRPEAVCGQVVGLLGPSGIGKTQLFHILSGLRKPDSGSVRIGEQGTPVQRGMVGVVAQQYPLFEHRTVLSNLLVAGRLAGLTPDKARDKAQALLERFNLGECASLYPAQISGGQRQRVAITQQMMCSEVLLLMDEPFSGLDCIALDKVQELISEVANSAELNTIIVVTHDISSALEIADTIWLLGRDCDPQGKLLSGARIKATYDLIERGLAWRKGISTEPAFLDLLKEIRDRFVTL
ncbi:MAG: ABC transporter ATP-binding protein [Bryobacteraceae bacterium]